MMVTDVRTWRDFARHVLWLLGLIAGAFAVTFIGYTFLVLFLLAFGAQS